MVHNLHHFHLHREQTQAQRLRGYLEGTLTGRDAAKEVRVFGLGPVLTGWWEHLYWRVADLLYRQRRRHYAMGGLPCRPSAFWGWAPASAGRRGRLSQGGLSAGQFAAMIVALRQVRFGVAQLVNRMGFLSVRLLNIADLFIYLDLGPEEPKGGKKHRRPCQDTDRGSRPLLPLSPGGPPRPRGDHRLHPAGRARRPGRAPTAPARPPSSRSCWGCSGPQAGELRYGGLHAEEVDRDQLRDQSAAVFQDYTRFAFTLGENIGFGRSERMGDPGEVERAARQGGADTVAGHLPEGYETLLTREFEGGTELSGGEWQRVAISRGFMRRAGLVVLDEPTASLDPQAEADVFRRFLSMSGGRTTIVVSHRLGSARLCDRILVLKEGRLVENGTHDELVSRGGEYARMWSLQAGWYGP